MRVGNVWNFGKYSGALFALGALAGPAAAQASGQLFQDPALQALHQADKADELMRAATQRLAARPDDAQAVLGVAMAALSRDDAAARQQALQAAEACVQQAPQAAPCHYAQGVVLGIQAMSEGLFKAARSAGTVRKALARANELEPAWYPARGALLEFYLLAPGMMGGSTAQAVELARAAPTPEQARALQARIAMQERRFDEGLKLLSALPAGLPPALAADVRQWAVQCGLGLVNNGQAAAAQPALEKLAREHPEQAGPLYALARVRAESGQHEAALALYEQAAKLRGADELPLAWRVGISQQALGRSDAAKASFQRFVAAGKGQKASLDDAKKRLAQLGA
jgi:tetratricopeptide (TPR) repeat protein